MGSSSRAARPAPLYTTAAPSHAAASRSAYDSTPRSAGAGSLSSEKAPFSPTSYTRRTDSTGSTASAASTDSYQTMSAGENARKVSTGSVNANSFCGRHSDQFLFGGWGDIVKGVFHPKKN